MSGRTRSTNVSAGHVSAGALGVVVRPLQPWLDVDMFALFGLGHFPYQTLVPGKLESIAMRTRRPTVVRSPVSPDRPDMFRRCLHTLELKPGGASWMAIPLRRPVEDGERRRIWRLAWCFASHFGRSICSRARCGPPIEVAGGVAQLKGSASHAAGTCKPCIFINTPEGCGASEALHATRGQSSWMKGVVERRARRKLAFASRRFGLGDTFRACLCVCVLLAEGGCPDRHRPRRSARAITSPPRSCAGRWAVHGVYT